jgi:hypothetical protein
MRIDITSGSQTSLGLNPTNANRAGATDGVPTDPTAADQAVIARQFQPTSEFLPLVDTLGRIPFIRQEILGEVASRLSGGELDTPQAREQVVESMLGAAPGHD